MHGAISFEAAMITRRRFVEGLAAAGIGGRVLSSPASAMPVLAGSTFDLAIGALPVNITGRPRDGNRPSTARCPAPILRWREGDTVTLNVTNRSRAELDPLARHPCCRAPMDGVPGLSFRGIAPGETFTYRFPVRQSGTYWYHSHSAFQEQTGLYGPIVIEPRGGYAAALRSRLRRVAVGLDRRRAARRDRQQSQIPERLLQFPPAHARHLHRRRRAQGLAADGRRPARVGRDAHEPDRHPRRLAAPPTPI